MKISIPKSFFEDKHSITHIELLEMFTNVVSQIDELEENANYLQYVSTEQSELVENLQKENQKLREENEKLKRGQEHECIRKRNKRS